MTIHSPEAPARTRGRPRTFDRDAALEAARDVFWERGYERSSLDDLTAAMAISRSSFYAAFGTKQALLLAAIRLYVAQVQARIDAAIAAAADPDAALVAALQEIADVDGGPRGCFFANCIVEFGQRDPAVAAIVEAHLAWLDARLAGCLARAGRAGQPAAAHLLALCTGLITLRKAGWSPDTLRAMIREAALTPS